MSGHVALVCLCVLFVWSVSSTETEEDAWTRIVGKRSQCKPDLTKVEEKLHLTTEQLTTCTSRLEEAQQKIFTTSAEILQSNIQSNTVIQNLNEKYDKLLENINSIKNKVEAGFVLMTSERNSKFNDLQSKHREMLEVVKETRRMVDSINSTSLQMVSLGDRHLYHFSHDLRMSWYTARDFCVLRGLSLASIESAEENQLVTDQLQKLGMRDTWLGASDEAREGTWRWTGTRATLTYTNWRSRQPNGGTWENCMYIHDGEWFDNLCTNKFPFICEQQN